jgi:hypothetical protein
MVIMPPRFAASYSAAAVSIGPALASVRRVNGAVLAGIGVFALAASPVFGSPALASGRSRCNGPTSTASYWLSLA